MNKWGKIVGTVLVLIIMVSIVCSLTTSNNDKKEGKEEFAYLENTKVAANTVEEEEVIHTHIWATIYDKDKHWEYCTVCDKIRNEEEHIFEDNWFFGYPSCHTGSGTNYSTRICSCGYSYIYHKPHENISGWNNTGVRMEHFRRCNDCGSWTIQEFCYNDKGRLGCNNPGTCNLCGVTATKDWHLVTGTKDGKGGQCRDCGKRFFNIEDYSLTYTDDYSAAIIEFTFVPLEESVEFTGKMYAYTPNSNYSSVDWSYEMGDDGSCHYKGVYTFDPTRQRKTDLYFCDATGLVKVNGIPLFINTKLMHEIIWQDHDEAEVTEVKQVDQATSGDWATIKELTITGTENLSNIVVISIIDKETKEVVVDKAKTNVINGKYEYKCTPAIEGPVEGRDYILKVTDEIGNVKEHVFTIYRTDSRAPLLKQSEFTEWSKTKHLEIPITDYGSGLAQTSLDNQYTYQDTKYENGKYYGLYTFAEENYGIDDHVFYLRDGLGNARREWIKVGRVDNTKPTIKQLYTSKDSDGASIEIVGDDYSEKMKAQGSGVVDYAITKSADSDPSSWKQTSTLKITEAGTYYLWVRDRAGNIGDVKQIEVTPDDDVIIPDDDVTIDGTSNKILISGDKYIYAYCRFDIKEKDCTYIKSSKMSFGVYGEKNNDEEIYIYLSSSPDSVWDSSECDGSEVDADILIQKLKTDCNILNWNVTNTREVSRSGGIYTVKGNNICTVESADNMIEYIGRNNDMRKIYIHAISQSGKEYVTRTGAIKRAIFEQH